MFEPIHGSAFDIAGKGLGRTFLFLFFPPFFLRGPGCLECQLVTDDMIDYAANPVGTFWTAAEMLSWLGEKQAASILLDCVEAVCEKRIVTQDLGGKSTTVEVTDAVCEAIEAFSRKS